MVDMEQEPDFPAGGGEMGELIRAYDWSKAGLGPRSAWPPCLRTAVNIVLASPVPIVMLWGPDGIMLYNDAYSVFAGGRHPRLLGSPVLEGWPEVADFNRHVMDVGMSGGTLSFHDTHLVLLRNGIPEDVWLDLNYSPILDEDQKPAGVFAVVVETTQRVQAETNLRELNATLEERVAERTAALHSAQAQLQTQQKMEAVGKLTGGVAHDFNNLLQAISGCLQMVRRRTGEPQIHSLLDAGRQAVDRGAKLVQQLMAFSRQQSLNPQSFDLRDRLLKMSGLLERALREDIERTVKIAPDLWPVNADQTQFELALINLTVNARDAMPIGGSLTYGAANVSLTGDGPEGLSGDFVRISVTDTGTGMTADVLAQAYEPFFTTKGLAKGSGLGLSQVYGFCRQSGGTVTIDSMPGTGTTATLFLPRASRAPVSDGVHSPPLHPPTRGIRVLMVEDEALVADVVAAALRDLGYKVSHAASGDEALERLRDGERLDILFTDVVMPGLINGAELAREAQHLRPGLPVLLATGYSENAAITGGLPVIAKPYGIETLASAIESAMAEIRIGSME